MSRSLSNFISSTILLVGLFVTFHSDTVLAQVVNLPNGVQIGVPAAPTSPTTPGAVRYNTASPLGPTATVPLTPAEQAAANATANVTQEVPATTLGNPIYDLLYSFVLTVFGSLLAMAGALMSYGMNEFVLGFGTQYFDKNVGQAVEATWTVIRDLFNLTFIFGLVYIGFKMILDSSDSRARSMLISLIGAALLVNFSLFIVKFIIDVANITAVMIAKNGFAGQDIANSFINLINLSTILNISQSQVSFLAQNGGAFSYIFGLMIFLATATFVLAAAGILFIVRFVVLNIYLVMSPVMFIGWVFPSMQSYSSKFWSGFLGNAFFAPAYLLMIYLSYTVLSSYKISLGKTIDYGRLMAGSGDPQEAISMMHVVPFFVLAMVFMVASLVVAKKMGAVGASTAVSFGNKLRGSAQGYMKSTVGGAVGGATFGLAARAGQTAIGGSASRLSNNATFKRITARAPGGKALYNATTKVADSSFDGRNVGGLGKAIGVGAGFKGGNTTRIKELAESDKKFMEALGTIDFDKTKPIADNLNKQEAAKANIAALDVEKKTASSARAAQIDAEITANQTQIDDLQKQYSAAKLKSAEVEYANQLAYIKGLEKWKKAKNILVTGAAIVGAGALTGGAGLALGYGLAGISAAVAGGATAGTAFGFGNSFTRNQATKKARQEYGDDGIKKKNAEQRKKDAKILSDIIKDSESKKSKDSDAKDKDAH